MLREKQPVAVANRFQRVLERKDVAVLLLALASVFVYRNVMGYGYLDFDDSGYLVDNPWIKHGLSLDSLRWALTATRGHFWGPVTWLSFIGEVHLFGMRATVSHTINLVLHLANSILLYVFLRVGTRAPMSALLVAMLFVVHPLHVESVAWATERKDVLSAFFGLLTLIAWQAHVRNGKSTNYMAAVLMFALAICTKPSMVMLPVMMVLTEYWPLQRKQIFWRQQSAEMFPFVVASLAVAVITVHVQEGEVLAKEEHFASKFAQLACVAKDYLFYLGKMLWPDNLAVFYPREPFPSMPWLVAAIVGLPLLTLLAFRHRRQQPWLWMGWLWFVLTLLPMSGLVTFGRNVAADRFVYVPSIGIFIMLVWGWDKVLPLQKQGVIGAIVWSTVIVAGAIIAHRQTTYWKDDEALFSHAAAVTDRNYLAYNNLGHYYLERQQAGRALAMFWQANDFYPDHYEILNSLGIAYQLTGDASKAEEFFRHDIAVSPDYGKPYVNLGALLTRERRFDEAIPLFQKALAIDSDNEKALNNLAALYLLVKQPEKSVPLLQYAAILAPDNGSIYYNLGYAYYLQGKRAEALAALDRAKSLLSDSSQLAQLRSLAEALPP